MRAAPVVAIIDAFLITAFARYLKFNEHTRTELQTQVDDLTACMSAMETELASGKAVAPRVRVLESIVTDSCYQLDQESKNLK